MPINSLEELIRLRQKVLEDPSSVSLEELREALEFARQSYRASRSEKPPAKSRKMTLEELNEMLGG